MCILIIFLILNTSPVCLAQEKTSSAQEIGGFSLVQYEEDGEKKWKLDGKAAEVEDGTVKIEEVSALAFGEDTTLKLKAEQGNFNRIDQVVHLENNVVVKATDGTTLTTDSLDWDRETENVFSDAAVNIKKGNFDVNGTGAEVDLGKKTAELKENVTANIDSVAPAYLQATTTENRATITCDGPLELNYKKNRAAFLNNVKVEDVEGDIFADRIDVYFNPDTRRIKCVVARGNVKIVNGENVTYSEKAIYLVNQGRVILPKRPKLVIQSTNGRE